MHWKRTIFAACVTLATGCHQSTGDAHDDSQFSVLDPLTPAEMLMNPVEPHQLGDCPETADLEQCQALWWVNTFRARAGLGPVHQLESLNTAAMAHAKYVLKNADLYEDNQLSVHEQLPNYDGFYGERFWDRLSMAKYDGAPFREVIAYQAESAAAVAHWMETVYHRLPLMEPAARHVGYAQLNLGQSRINVLDMGLGQGTGSTVPGGVMWPPVGAIDVPTSWDGLETPQPQAPHSGFPSGPVVSLTFAMNSKVAVNAHVLTDVTDGGVDVPHVFLSEKNDPNLKGESSVVLYANEPLMPGHVYQVNISGRVDGAVFDRTWRFTTRKTVGCDLLVQNCDIGKACYGSSHTDAACAWVGSSGTGESCEFQNDCATGSTCVAGVCRRYCSSNMTGAADCREMCPHGYTQLNLEDGVGACKLASNS